MAILFEHSRQSSLLRNSPLGHAPGPAQDSFNQSGFAQTGGVQVQNGNAQLSIAANFLFQVVVERTAFHFDGGGDRLARYANEQQTIDAKHRMSWAHGHLWTLNQRAILPLMNEGTMQSGFSTGLAVHTPTSCIPCKATLTSKRAGESMNLLCH